MANFKMTPQQIEEKTERMRRSFDQHIENGRLNTQQACKALYAFSNKWNELANAVITSDPVNEINDNYKVIILHDGSSARITTLDSPAIREAMQITEAAHTALYLAVAYEKIVGDQIRSAPFFKGLRLVSPLKR